MFLGFFLSLVMQGFLPEEEKVVLLDRLVILLGELAFLAAPIFILKQRGLKVLDVVPLKSITPTTFLMALVLVTGVIGMVSIYEVLILPFFPLPQFLQQFESELAEGGLGSLLLLILAGTIVAPVVEEFLFRGILQQSLFYRYGSIIPAIIIPTAIFALFHVAYLFYLPAFLELLALAVLLGWLTVKTGNILIPMLVHGVFNLSSFSTLLYPELETIETVGDLGLPWIILSSVLFVGGWVYFKFMPVSVHEEVYLISPLRKGD